MRKSKKFSQVTCPGIAGFCSEAYVGDTCLVVCERGRNNVPQCQEDGTWTDIPRCIEHEPGIEQQVTEFCPGIPGYCSLDWPGALCEFQCSVGPPIRSSCTPDGTWEPYPTCQGDPRETQDGCDPCPGPVGGPRNRSGGGSLDGRGTRLRNAGNLKGGGSSHGTSQAGGVRGRNRGSVRGGGRRHTGGGSRNQGGGFSSSRNRRPSEGFSSSNSLSNGRGHGKSSASRRNGVPNKQSGGNRGRFQNQCPGEIIDACLDVCPGLSVRAFGACARDCARRCSNKK